MDDPILSGKICPYCNEKSELTDSAEIYGTSYGPIYLCRPCGAFVGTHKGTDRALGRLANKELREAKKEAHRLFDSLWRKKIIKSRTAAYKWLASKLNISAKICHIGMMDVETCKKVVEICKLKIKKSRDDN